MKRGHLTLLPTVVAVVLIAAQAAWAGTYRVSTCNNTLEGVNNSWTWAVNDPSQPVHYAEHKGCPYRIGGSGGLSDQEGGLSTTDALGLSNGAPPGTSAAWSFIAPAGTTIAAFEYERYLGHEFDSSNSWVPALRFDGTVAAGESCLDTVEDGETCSVGGPPDQGGLGVFTGLSAREMSIGIVCAAPAEEVCVTGGSRHPVWAAMYGATVTVDDPTPPTLAEPTGSLWGSGEAGAHKGTESVAVAAQDVGGGVQSIALYADGHQVGSYGAACNFTFAQPCPGSIAPQTFSLATSSLANGEHTISLVANDAAGNQSALSEQIDVQNPSPSAPEPASPATTTPTALNGSPAVRTAAVLQLGEALKGRELVVRVRSHASGKVRVSFTGLLHGRTVASGAKTVTLKNGKATATFRLGNRTAARALIRVSAKLDHQVAVTSTLRRHAAPRRR